MSLHDEVKELRRQLVELARNTAHIPVRLADGGSGGGGGSTSLTGDWGMATNGGISAATSHLEVGPDSTGWGGGDMELLDPVTGELTGSVVAVTNRWPVSYADGALVRNYGDGDVQGVCGPQSSTFWAE